MKCACRQSVKIRQSSRCSATLPKYFLLSKNKNSPHVCEFMYVNRWELQSLNKGLIPKRYLFLFSSNAVWPAELLSFAFCVSLWLFSIEFHFRSHILHLVLLSSSGHRAEPTVLIRLGNKGTTDAAWYQSYQSAPAPCVYLGVDKAIWQRNYFIIQWTLNKIFE